MYKGCYLLLTKCSKINVVMTRFKSVSPSRGTPMEQVASKGRVPKKIQRYKAALGSFSGSNFTKERDKGAILTSPTLYFKSKRQSVSVVSKVEEDVKETQSKEENQLLADVVVSLDCEMVRCAGNQSIAARCSIVDYYGNMILDLYMQPPSPVVDYCSRYSGITPKTFSEHRSVDFKTGQDMIKKIIKGKIVVGHSLKYDFKACSFSHPKRFRADLIEIKALRCLIGDSKKISLKFLSNELLNRRIQVGSHCSVEDSRAAMDLFRLVEDSWLAENEEIVLQCKKMQTSFMDDEYWPDEMKND